MSETLYNLTEKYINMSNALDNIDQLDPNSQCTALSIMQQVNDSVENKADGYAQIIKNEQADIDACKAEIARLQNRVKTKTNKINWLKNNLFNSMKAMNKLKFKTPLFNFSIAKAGGKQKLTLLMEPEQLPDEFKKVEYKADNDALRQMLEQNNLTQCQYCKLEPRSESLKIK